MKKLGVLLFFCWLEIQAAYSGIGKRKEVIKQEDTTSLQSKIAVGFYKTSADVEKRGATLLVSKKEQELIIPFLRYPRSFVWGEGGEMPMHDKIASKSGIVPITKIVSEFVPGQEKFYPSQVYIVDCIDQVDGALVQKYILHLICVVPWPCVLPLLAKIGTQKPQKNMRVDFVPARLGQEIKERMISREQVVEAVKKQFRDLCTRNCFEVLLKRKYPKDIVGEIGLFIGHSFKELPGLMLQKF